MALGLKVDTKRKAEALLSEERASCLLFFAGFSIWLVWKYISITVLALPGESRINSAVHALTWLLLAVPAIRALLDADTRVPSLGIVAIGLISKLVTGEVDLLDLSILLCASRGISFKEICSCVLKLIAPLFVLTVVLSQLGAITNYEFTRGAIVRYGLGFLYSTFSSMLFMYLTMIYFYIYDLRPPFASYIVVVLIDVALFTMTNTRAPFCLVLLLCLVSLAFRVDKVRQAWIASVTKPIKYFPCAVMVVSLAVTVAYNPQMAVWSRLNTITSNRIAQTQNALTTYGVEPFGQYVDLKGNALEPGDSDGTSLMEDGDRNFVDSSFMSCLIKKGYITTLLLLFVLTRATNKAYETRDYAGCIVLAVVYLSTAFDIQLLQLVYNTFLFYIWGLFVSKTKESETI